MKTKLIILLTFLSLHAFAQDEAFRIADKSSPDSKGSTVGNGVNVDKYNGTASVSIPLGNFSGREMNLPLSMNNSASGIKVDQLAGVIGLGWNLNAGGRMVRIMHGAPDGHVSGNYETEDLYMPESKDFFKVDAPGISEIFRNQFAYPQGDPLCITNGAVGMARTAGINNTAEYVVTTQDGVKYYFGQDGARELISSTTLSSNGIDYVTSEYTTTWLLTKIVSKNGLDEYRFTYANYNWQQMISYGGEGKYTSGINIAEQLSPSSYKINQQVLTEIYHNDQKIISLNYTGRSDMEYVETGGTTLSEIFFYNYQSTQAYRKIGFEYNYFGNPLGTYLEKRLKLDKITQYAYDSSNSTWLTGDTHGFDYFGEGDGEVPSIASHARDLLGLYNAKDLNQNSLPYPTHRDYNFEASLAGTLEKVDYPSGGSTVFEYEQNAHQGGYGHELIYQDPVTTQISIPLGYLSSYDYCEWGDIRYYGIHEDYLPNINSNEFGIPNSYMNTLKVDLAQTTLLDLSAEPNAIDVHFTTSGFGFYAIQSLASCDTPAETEEECGDMIFYPCLRDTRDIFYTPDTPPSGFISGGLTENGSTVINLLPGKYQVTIWDMDDIGNEEPPVVLWMDKRIDSTYTPEPILIDHNVSSQPADGFRIRSITDYDAPNHFAAKKVYKYGNSFTTDRVENYYLTTVSHTSHFGTYLSRGYSNPQYIHFSKVFEITSNEDESDNNGYTVTHFPHPSLNLFPGMFTNGQDYPFNYTSSAEFPVYPEFYTGHSRLDLPSEFRICTKDDKLVRKELYGYTDERWDLPYPIGFDNRVVHGAVTILAYKEITNYGSPGDAGSAITTTETYASFGGQSNLISYKNFNNEIITEYNFQHPALELSSTPNQVWNSVTGYSEIVYGTYSGNTYNGTSITRIMPQEIITDPSTTTAPVPLFPQTKTKYEYDLQGNMVTQIQYHPGTLTPASYECYIHGYSDRFVVAKIVGLKYSDLDATLVTNIKDASNLEATPSNNTALVNALKALQAWVGSNTIFKPAQMTAITYNPSYGPVCAIDAKGMMTTNEYDAFGRITFTRVYDPEQNNFKILSENAYHTRSNTAGDQNWVKQKTYKIASTTPVGDDLSESTVSMTYLDGLGRTVEQIAHKQSESTNDIGTYMGYDDFGRQAKTYLPYARQDDSMAFVGDASGIIGFLEYSGQFPYSEKLFDGSPLNRVLKISAPGTIDNWAMGSDHEIAFDYGSNESDGVRKFEYANGAVTDMGVYGDHMLYKNTTTDENGHVTREFKNTKGQLVLNRALDESGNAYDTYYLYDVFNNLVVVVPPKATDPTNNNILKNLCYQYTYDKQNRLVEKQLPGKQPECIVYDKLDRIVMTGPALDPLGSGGTQLGWLHTFYDGLGRVAYTGWSPTASSSPSLGRKSWQQDYDAAQSWTVSKTDTPRQIDNVAVNYTDSGMLPTGFMLLTVSYYDDYQFPHGTINFAAQVGDKTVYYNDLILPVSLPTGSWVRVLDGSAIPKGDTSYVLYDKWAVPIVTSKTNYLGGYTKTESEIGFSGQVNVITTTHQKDAASVAVTTANSFQYNGNGSIDKNYLAVSDINSYNQTRLSVTEYDKLGRLNKKYVGDIGGTPLQEVNYKYNIRGWLTDINDVGATGTSDLFAFRINYDKVAGLDTQDADGVAPLYNGNISETYWRSGSDDILRRYGYRYDGLNRMLQGVYYKPDSSVPTNSYNETVDYDPNGNITNMQRNGNFDLQGMTNEIDDLQYRYADGSNRLECVVDASNSPLGFKDNAGAAIQDTDYTYDADGNLISDDNKGIRNITYNHLNLPVAIDLGNDRISYLYDALGNKVGKEVHTGSSVKLTEYFDGFQYVDRELRLFPTSEGYVSCTETSQGYVYKFVYQYKDHLGNIRMSYALNEEDVLSILEENHYYPFGLRHTNYNGSNKEFGKVSEGGIEAVVLKAPPVDPGGSANLAYKYRFNAMEWQEELGLNLYDMDMRDYDPAIGRWTSIDPVTHFDMSPYVGMDNNPVSIADPSGADGVVYGMAGQTAWSNPFPRGHQSFGYTLHGEGQGQQGSLGGNGSLYGGTTISDGGIFWGSEAMQYEQSYEGRIAAGITTTSDPINILSIYNYYAVQNGFSPSQPAGTLTTVNYSVYQTPTHGGLNILLGYKDNGSGLTNFNYVQSITTNVPLGGATSPYNDPQPPDDSLPFYYTNAELPTFTNTRGYDVMFTDRPSRVMNNGTSWQAELSVVGMNGSGKYVPIYTISYGFNITNGAINLVPISYITPSAFHLNSF